jgi:hypothetical protein
MIPPNSFMEPGSDKTPDRFEFSADPESLRLQRRPATINRARHTLETIAESVNSLKGFLDGPTRFLDRDLVEVCLKFPPIIEAEDPIFAHRNLVKRSHSSKSIPRILRHPELDSILPQIVRPNLSHESPTIFELVTMKYISPHRV